MMNNAGIVHLPLKISRTIHSATVFVRKYFEIIVLAGFIVLWLSLVIFFKMPIILPTYYKAHEFSIEYIFPLLMAIIIQVVLLLTFILLKKSPSWLSFKKIIFSILYIPFIFAVLFLHFNFKSWMPLIHPGTYDSVYYRIDNLTPIAAFFSSVGKLLDIHKNCNFLYFYLFFFVNCKCKLDTRTVGI